MNMKETNNWTDFLELCKNVFIRCGSIYCAETFVQKIVSITSVSRGHVIIIILSIYLYNIW